MEVTESGIVILVSPVQPENAEEPIEVTESGIVMLVSESKLSNAWEPIEVADVTTTVFKPAGMADE